MIRLCGSGRGSASADVTDGCGRRKECQWMVCLSHAEIADAASARSSRAIDCASGLTRAFLLATDRPPCTTPMHAYPARSPRSLPIIVRDQIERIVVALVAHDRPAQYVQRPGFAGATRPDFGRAPAVAGNDHAFTGGLHEPELFERASVEPGSGNRSVRHHDMSRPSDLGRFRRVRRSDASDAEPVRQTFPSGRGVTGSRYASAHFLNRLW